MKKIINFTLILIIIGIIIVPALLLVKNNHEKSLKLVMEKEIVEAATKCQRENKCTDTTVTLSYLQNNGYLSKVYDPVTKELVSVDSYVIIDENKLVIK